MIIPIRCFTCGKVIGNKWESYLGLLQAEYTEGQVKSYFRSNILALKFFTMAQLCHSCLMRFALVLRHVCSPVSLILTLRQQRTSVAIPEIVEGWKFFGKVFGTNMNCKNLFLKYTGSMQNF